MWWDQWWDEAPGDPLIRKEGRPSAAPLHMSKEGRQAISCPPLPEGCWPAVLPGPSVPGGCLGGCDRRMGGGGGFRVEVGGGSRAGG